MADTETSFKKYDFSRKNPDESLTDDELEHFEEGMKLRNESEFAGNISLKQAVQSVTEELDELFA